MIRRCPACSSVLYRSRAHVGGANLEVEACPGCAGCWLEDGRLSALGKDPAAMRKLAQSIVATEPPLKPEHTGKCPADGAALAPVEYPAFPGIQLLACHGCRGVFAASGILGALADRLGAPAAPPHAPHSGARPGAPAPSAQSVADGGITVGAAAAASAMGIGVGGGGGTARATYAAVPGASTFPQADPSDPTSTAGLPLVNAVDLPSYSRPAGFFDRLQRGFAFVKKAYALAFEKPSLLVPTIAGAGVSLFWSALVGGMVFLSWTTAHAAGTDPSRWAQAHHAMLTIAALVWMLGSYFVAYFFMGMTISMIDAWVKGREPSFTIAFADSMKNLFGIIQLALVSMLVSIVIGFVRGDRRSSSLGGALFGMVREAIARALEEAWTVLSFLLLPVIMIEDVGLGTALGRVRDIHRGNLMQIAVGELGILLAARVIGFVAFLVMAPIGFLLVGVGGTAGIIPLVILVVVVSIVLGTLQTFVRGAYYTCLYLWAYETERQRYGERATVRVPAPLAAALAR